MEGKLYVWISKGLLCTVLWGVSGVPGKASVIEMPPDVVPMRDENNFQGMELTIAPEKSGFNAVATRAENSSSIRGELGMSHAKLCDVFSRYGSLINSQWQSKQALEELENINNFLDLVLIPEEQSVAIRSNPQLFLDGIAPWCGGIAYGLEITNGSAISSSMYPNFFKTLYCSNQRPVYAGRLSTNDDKVVKKMSELFAGRAPIRGEEADKLLKNGELKNPSGVILYVIDRAADKVYMAANAPVHGKFENVFTKNKFGAWTQQSAKWRHRGKGVKQATEAVASTAADVGASTVKMGIKGSLFAAPFAPRAFEKAKSVVENIPQYKEKIGTAVGYVNRAANAVNSVANGTGGTAKFLSWMPFSKSITETLGSASSALKPVGETIKQFGGKLASASENLTWVSEKVAPVIANLSPTLGPILAALKIARLVGLDEFAQKMPQVLYPAGDSEVGKLLIIHAKAAIALSGVKAKELSRDPIQMRRAAQMSDRVHLYDAAITLTEDWKQGLAQYPQEAAAQLAIGTARNVCCLVVTSGRFMCPNFFQKLYSFQYDPDGVRVVPEITRASGIYDRKVCSVLGEKCPIDALLNTDTLLYIIDDTSKEVYQVVYDNGFSLPPQFPNIFNPQSWENWEGAIAPTTGWRLRKAMRLLGATSYNALLRNVFFGGLGVPGQLAMDGRPKLEVPVNVDQLGMERSDFLRRTESETRDTVHGQDGTVEPRRDPASYSDHEFIEEAPFGMSDDEAMASEVSAIRTSVPVQQAHRDPAATTKNISRGMGIRKAANYPGTRPRRSGYRPAMMRSKRYGNGGIILGSPKFRQDSQPQFVAAKNDPYASKFVAGPMNEPDDEPWPDEIPGIHSGGRMELNVNGY